MAPLSLLVELAIGVGFAIPATRAVAAVGGTVFHLGLGYHPLSPILLFSLTMVALYSSAWPKGPALLLPFARVTLLGSIAASLAILADAGLYGVLTAWLVGQLVVLFIPVLFLRHAVDRSPAWPRATPWLGAVALVLPLLNTVPAHTGHRQFNSFDMYSNLVVNADGSNHLFLPSLASASPAAERIRVLESDPPGFTHSIEEGDKIARVELVRILRQGLVESISWSDAEGTHRWERGQALPDDGISWWDLKSRRMRAEPSIAVCVDCPLCRLEP